MQDSFVSFLRDFFNSMTFTFFQMAKLMAVCPLDDKIQQLSARVSARLFATSLLRRKQTFVTTAEQLYR